MVSRQIYDNFLSPCCRLHNESVGGKFLDIAQTFDCIWHDGLIYKLNAILPGNFCKMLENYLKNHSFTVLLEEKKSNIQPTQRAVCIWTGPIYIMYYRYPNVRKYIYSDVSI